MAEKYYDDKYVKYMNKKLDMRNGLFLTIVCFHYAHVGNIGGQVAFLVTNLLYATPLAFIPFFWWVYQLCTYKTRIEKFNLNLRHEYGVKE